MKFHYETYKSEIWNKSFSYENIKPGTPSLIIPLSWLYNNYSITASFSYYISGSEHVRFNIHFLSECGEGWERCLAYLWGLAVIAEPSKFFQSQQWAGLRVTWAELI